jgi:phosphopantothenoylcysteine decarboxylase/phosphopantothenate--cysteine ligase
VQDPVDLLLISPCTANTISKIARGIDDTPVTTCATTAIGSKVPIVLVPAMHLSMFDHAIVQNNIDLLRSHGVVFIDPDVKGNKAKLPEIDEIVETVVRTIGKRDFLLKKILIIGGGTAEPIDDIRVITNRSSGKTAVALTMNAFERGADVELWYGHGTEPVPSYISCKNFETVADLLRLTKHIRSDQFEIIIVCAAIANYIPKKQKGKIRSGQEKLVIELSQAPVLLKSLRSMLPQVKLIAFKTEEKKALVKRKTQQMLLNYRLDAAVGNTLAGFGAEENEVLLLTKRGKSIWKKGKKEELASAILDLVK